MAHKDACKYQVQQFMKKLVTSGMAISAAAVQTEKESDGIPAETCRRWWYEVQKETDELFKNEQQEPTPQDNKESGQKHVGGNNKMVAVALPKRQQCSCGQFLVGTYKHRDGRVGYRSLCDKCRQKKTQQNKQRKEDAKPSTDPQSIERQQQVWQEIEKRLSELAQYMMDNCELPSGINGGLKLRLVSSLDTIKIFVEGGQA